MQLPIKLIKIRYVTIISFILFQIIFLWRIQQQNGPGSSLRNTMIQVYDQSTSSSTYKKLLKSFKPQEFVKKPLDERCQAYFDELFKIDENWKIPDLKGMDFSLDVFNRNQFYKDKYNKLKEEGKEVDPSVIFDELQKKLNTNDQIENSLIDNAGHLRIYGKCYTDDNSMNHPRCLDIESRLFPFLTFEPPISERWDGTVVKDWLNIGKYYQYDEATISKKPLKQDFKMDSCYLRNLKQQMNGRGIVISIGDQFIDEIVNLIKVLRYQGNQLPIEFVHKGDLAQKSKDRIIELARKDIYIPKLDMTLKKYRQEVWFIDAKRCFVESYYYNFSYFANKWVAVMFNTFEEMFLMDSDSVPFVEPNEFFNILDGYKKKGAYFFKDRESGEVLPNEYKNIFVKMLPTEIEQLFFEIPTSTKHTLETKFMKNNARHYMESGIVLMNRKQHLLGILMAVHIQFWGPLNTFIYGEKEIFWLGQSIAGDENYEFNTNPVGAIGVITATDFDHSIVGSHPAHMHPDDKTLLWVNSGMETCKKHTWEQDFKDIESIHNKYGNEENLKQHYLSPLVIEGVIIPPDATNKYPNDAGRPSQGWANKRELGCNGYYWIAHLRVGNNADDPQTIGKEIDFNEEQRELYNMISKLWVYDYQFKNVLKKIDTAESTTPNTDNNNNSKENEANPVS